MISGTNSHAENYKCFLINLEYLMKWVSGALEKLKHKHWWALTSRTSEEKREIGSLVYKEKISLSPKKKEEKILGNLCSLSRRIRKHCFSALILQKPKKRCHSLLSSIIYGYFVGLLYN